MVVEKPQAKPSKAADLKNFVKNGATKLSKNKKAFLIFSGAGAMDQALQMFSVP